MCICNNNEVEMKYSKCEKPLQGLCSDSLTLNKDRCSVAVFSLLSRGKNKETIPRVRKFSGYPFGHERKTKTSTYILDE